MSSKINHRQKRLLPKINNTHKPTSSDKDGMGFAKCTVLPPKQLFIPTLLLKISEKLLFPLCKQCAKEKQTKNCKHNEQQRSISGTWCISKLLQAVKDGYKIKSISQLLIYPRQENVFADFIAKFYTLKQKYLGIPKSIENKDNFVKELVDYILNVFGIKIHPSEIHFERNNRMRAVMKLILNSLWGKFCQRNSTTHTLFVTDAKELWMALSNKQYGSVYMNKMDSRTLRLTCKTKPSYINPNNFICFARLELLRKVRQLPDNSIPYFDTDSIYYSESRKPLIQEGFKII